MTHWIVRITNSRFVAALKIIRERIIDAYKQKPREFVEILLSLSLSIGFMVYVIQLFGLWPIPHIPKTTAQTQTFAEGIERIKPTIVHLFALAGAAFLVRGFGFWYCLIHVFDSGLIKAYQYQKFVRAGRRKISE